MAEAIADRASRVDRDLRLDDRRGTGAAAGQFSRGHRVVLSRGLDARRGRCQASLSGRHDPQPAGSGPGVAQRPARTLGTGADVRRCEPLALLMVDRAQSIVGSHLMDTTARTAARLAAGQALAAIVPARLAQFVAGASPTMTISKLTMAASLVVFAGLAAWGAVVLADARGPAERAGRHRPRQHGAPLVALARSRRLLMVLPRKRTPRTTKVKNSVGCRTSPTTCPRSSSTSSPRSVPRTSIPGCERSGSLSARK